MSTGYNEAGRHQKVSKLKQEVLALAVFAVPLLPLTAQDEADFQDSGLTFTIRKMKLDTEGHRFIFRAVLDNRTKKDWHMRSATMMVNAACKKGLRPLNFSVHLVNRDLADYLLVQIQEDLYSSGNSIKPGENAIVESFRPADPTCKFDSLGPVRFKDLKPVDDITQRSLDAHRRLQQSLDELKALQPTLDEIRKDEADRRRAFCHVVYAATANKKISDLTVKEAQEVQACQALSYYQ